MYILLGSIGGVVAVLLLIRSAHVNATFDALVEPTFRRAFHYDAQHRPTYMQRCFPAGFAPQLLARAQAAADSSFVGLRWLTVAFAVGEGRPAISLLGVQTTYSSLLRFFAVQLTVSGVLIRLVGSSSGQ